VSATDLPREHRLVMTEALDGLVVRLPPGTRSALKW
jgi:hypothetical protein